jgi:hypothetical protein
MGYELKLYVVDPSGFGHKDKFAKINDEFVFVFSNDEGKLYFYNESDEKKFIDPDTEILEKKYCQVVAMVDICNPGYDSHIMQLGKSETDYFFYGSDGNAAIIDDRYGDMIQECDISEALESITKDCMDSDYRRFRTAKALLESCVDDYKNAKVLFFGY